MKWLCVQPFNNFLWFGLAFLPLQKVRWFKRLVGEANRAISRISNATRGQYFYNEN